MLGKIGEQSFILSNRLGLVQTEETRKRELGVEESLIALERTQRQAHVSYELVVVVLIEKYVDDTGDLVKRVTQTVVYIEREEVGVGAVALTYELTLVARDEAHVLRIIG